MGRKLRFFKDHMAKAGILPSVLSEMSQMTQAHTDFDELEVYFTFSS